MQCSKCRREAVLFQEYSGQYLCRQHFVADVEAKAKHEIRRHRWITSGDNIGVALSGDAGSCALLCFLKKLTSDRRDIRISAISVDEGIAKYRCPGEVMKKAALLDTECIMVSFKERFGRTLDEIVQEKGSARSCMYCRVLRNFLLNHVAMELRITKLAFSYTLDDEAAAVLNNILQDTPEILVSSDRASRKELPRILPFISVPEKEVKLYADLHVPGIIHSLCPYVCDTREGDGRSMLNGFSIRHPATKYALLNLSKNLKTSCISMADSQSRCEKCGEPADTVCQSCLIIGEMTDNYP